MQQTWYDLSLEILLPSGEVRNVVFAPMQFATALRRVLTVWDEHEGRIIGILLEEIFEPSRIRELNTGSPVKGSPHRDG